MLASGTNPFDLAWSNARQGLSDRAEKRPQILHPIRARPDHHDTERTRPEVVLVFND